MRRIFAAFCFLIPGTELLSQEERFDIASFIPPAGWQRNSEHGSLSFQYSETVNGITSFCQIILYPSKPSTGNADKDFNIAWKDLVAIPAKSNVKPAIHTVTDEGWIIVTGSANISMQAINYKSIVSTITGFGKTMSVQVNTAGGDYASTVEKFFNDLDLDSKAAVTIQSSNSNQSKINRMITMNDYDFIAPDKWVLQKNKDHLSIQNMESGCIIRIPEPQPSSGDLEQDARSVFEMMYQGWQYQRSGAQQYLLTKGFFPRGLEYCMMEAGMSKLSADGSRYDGFETGAALIVKAGSQIVIISIRHNTSLMGHTDCNRRYETMRRFFNSFTVKNVSIPKNDEDPAQTIIGSWPMAEIGAAAEYIFAANGNYAFYGAIGTASTSRDYSYEYLHIKTYSFQGDGSYSISGDRLTLKKRNGDTKQVRFRFEKISHGGKGWKDRLWMLTKDNFGEAEVCYDKRDE